ncbi:MAG: energy-coupling factor ABC transporter permease [Sulfuricellaceae bacterium]
MNLPGRLLPEAWYWGGHALFALVLGWALVTAPWRRLADDIQQHLWLGACVTLMVLWSIKTGIRPGLNFHLLGATAIALMFRAQLAIVAVAIVTVGITLAGNGDWHSLSLNALTMGVLPILLSCGLFRLTDKKLPNHLFVYIFVNAFFGGALAMAATGAASTLMLFLSGAYPLAYLKEHYFPYYILMGWSEAITTGMAITLMTVYRPDWLGTFDDKRYLSK